MSRRSEFSANVALASTTHGLSTTKWRQPVRTIPAIRWGLVCMSSLLGFVVLAGWVL